ncbi:MAG TPA: hypothetical protein VI997_06365 [Candidatus Thermoplasmatota archaeon]|nr:hypothetical protein [Candidatus Thermoplasmatota archaeon]
MSRARIVHAAVAATLLLTLASARAAPGGLTVDTAGDVELRGAVSIELREGAAALVTREATGEIRFVSATGTVHIWTWRAVHASTPSVPGAERVTVAQPVEEPRAAEFALDGSDVAFSLVDEGFLLAVVAREGGALAVEGATAGAGRPVWLADAVARGDAGADALPFVAPRLEWTWARGSAFVGTGGDWTGTRGFPDAVDPVLSARGPVAFQADGGNVTFVDAGGREQTIRLGNWRDDSAPGAPVDVFVRLLFEGEVADAHVPLSGAWGAAAPSASWVLRGSARWDAADVDGDVNGTRVAARGAPVEVQGLVVITPEPPLAALPAADRYDVQGDFASVAVGGRQVVAPPGGPPLAAVAVGGAAALAAALWIAPKVAAALYTRIAPASVLDHDRRRRMYEVVTARPGLYKRELQREVGLVWGLFSFHLRLLEDAGYVRLAKEGRYTLVFPATVATTGPVIPHPLARAAFDALPTDGAAVDLGELRRRLGVSDQLLRYHFRLLEARGLVRLEKAVPRGTKAMRVVDAASSGNGGAHAGGT